MRGTYLDTLRSELPRVVGGEVEVILEESLPSTMEPARDVLNRDERAGLRAVVVSEQQTAGRGRQGRTWSSTHGSGIYCSLGYNFAGEVQNLLSLATGVAIASVLRTYSNEIGLKWPNDIVVTRPKAGGWKLGGILVETTVRERLFSAVIGFGVNVTGDAPSGGVSLEQLVMRPLDKAEILIQLVSSIQNVCPHLTDEQGSILKLFDDLNVLIGRRIRFESGHEGESEGCVLGTAEDGALRVAVSGRERLLYSGDVHVIDWQ